MSARRSASRYIEPDTDSVVDFVEAVEAGASFVVFDLETTSCDVKRGEIVEIGAVRVRRRRDRRPLVDARASPTRGIVGKQVHGITEADVASAPSPRRRRASLHRLGRRATSSSATTSASTSPSWRPPSPTAPRVAPDGYMDTLALARDAYPDLGAHKLSELVSALRARRRAHASCADADAEATATRPPAPRR